MSMKLESAEDVAPRDYLHLVGPSDTPRPASHAVNDHGGVIDALSAISRILSARALLLCVVAAAFVLALRAESVFGLIALSVFGALVVLPVAALSYRRSGGGAMEAAHG